MSQLDIWLKNFHTQEQPQSPFVNGGLFLESSIPSSFAHVISMKTSSPTDQLLSKSQRTVMSRIDSWLRDFHSKEPRSPFVNGGIFLDSSIPDSLVRVISSRTSPVRYRCGFLSVSLKNDGVSEQSKVFLLRDGDDVAVEEGNLKKTKKKEDEQEELQSPFGNGGIFLESSVPSSFVHVISTRTSPHRYRCGFLSVSLKNDGVVVEESKVYCDGDDVVVEEGSIKKKMMKKKKVRVGRGGALNTTKHLWAGAVAAMVSRTFVAPLERLKLEYIVRGEQRNLVDLIKSIADTQGLKGFWKGNLVNILRTAPFKAINFCAYDTYRRQLLKLSGNEETTNVERFVAGAAAGMTATILCLPLDTIRTKLVAPGGEALGGVVGAFRYMIQTEGFFSLYKGLGPSIISMAPSGAVFYGVYDILKSAYLHSPEGMERIQNMSQEGQELNAFDQLELGPLRTLFYGAVAGACAEASTYPFEVLRRQLQLQVQANRLNAFATCAKIVERGGVPALYAGLVPSLLQVLPSASISYFVYECMKIVLKVD